MWQIIRVCRPKHALGDGPFDTQGRPIWYSSPKPAKLSLPGFLKVRSTTTGPFSLPPRIRRSFQVTRLWETTTPRRNASSRRSKTLFSRYRAHRLCSETSAGQQQITNSTHSWKPYNLDISESLVDSVVLTDCFYANNSEKLYHMGHMIWRSGKTLFSPLPA